MPNPFFDHSILNSRMSLETCRRAEITDVFQMQGDLVRKVEAELNKMIGSVM